MEMRRVVQVSLLLFLVCLSGCWSHRYRRNHAEDRKDHVGQWRKFEADEGKPMDDGFLPETMEKARRNADEEGKLPFSSRRLEKMLEKAILKIITGELSTADKLLLKSLNYSLEEIQAIRERELGKQNYDQSRKEEKKGKKKDKHWRQNSMEFNYPSRGDPDLEESPVKRRRDRITERVTTRDDDFDFEEYNRQAVLDYENVANKLEARSSRSEASLVDYEDSSKVDGDVHRETQQLPESLHQTFQRAMEPHVVFKIRYDDSEFDSSSGSDERSRHLDRSHPKASKHHRSPIFKFTTPPSSSSSRNTANSFHDSTTTTPVPPLTALPLLHYPSNLREETKVTELDRSFAINDTTEKSSSPAANSSADVPLSVDVNATENFGLVENPSAVDESAHRQELENKTNEINDGKKKISEYEGLEWVEDDVYRVIPALADSLGYEGNDENETSDYEDTSNYQRNPFSEESDNDTFESLNDTPDASVKLFEANANNSVENATASSSSANLTSYQQLALAHRRDQGQKAIEDIKSRVLALTGRFNLSTNTNQVQRERLTMFSPTCQIPRNTDEETWSDPYSMNMHFQLNLTSKEHVVAAKLRIYKLPQENVTAASGSFEDEDEYEKIRISVYYYTKSLRKHRSKKRLMDSVVTPLSSEGSHLALDVRQGLRFWRPSSKSSHGSGNNHGLVVQVEDQDGRPLKPAFYIQKPSCSDENLDEKAYQRKPALFIRACARYVRIVNGETVTYVNCRH
ncbi:uncharacterized protein [Prorops nasuta]|uniref:uncharacterized protein isoform X2 n=1 Tax=Prorops nasuta TaxID=863751 RepID=UPI0034D00482